MSTNRYKTDYIVVRRPTNTCGEPTAIAHIVISRKELYIKIDDYLNGVIEQNPNVSAFVDLFNHLVAHRRVYTYSEAIKRAGYLNKRNREINKEVNHARRN